jgi:glycosyltransferase involved in cell wall biosynthesis
MEGTHCRRELWLFDDAPILGGAELFGLHLVRWTDGDSCAGWRARLFCPGDSELARRARAQALEVHDLRFPKPPRGTVAGVPALMRVRRILSGAPETVVAVANTALAQAYLAAAVATLRRHPPVVHLLHERETADRPSARWVLPRSGALVAVGEKHAGSYREVVRGASVDAVNVFLEPEELDAAAARRTGPHDPGRPVVGMLGRLIPEKGVLELLDELAAQPGAWSRIRVAGAPQDPAYAGRVASRANGPGLAGRVELLGHVDDVGSFLSTVDVVVVPSTGSEGQVLVILEALAQGLPCVVREAVLSPEYAGLPVVGYRDSDSLATALSALPRDTAEPSDLARRFGPEQALAGIERAADRLRGPRPGRPRRRGQ